MKTTLKTHIPVPACRQAGKIFAKGKNYEKAR